MLIAILIRMIPGPLVIKRSIPFLLAALACAATGCANGHGSLTITARQTKNSYFEEFSKAKSVYTFQLTFLPAGRFSTSRPAIENSR